MAVTQDDLDALNQAVRDGVRQVTLQGQTTVYNTTDSLIKARDDAQTAFNLQQIKAAGRRLALRTHMYYAGRGYD